MLNLIDPHVVTNADPLAIAFQHAQPFRHLVVEHFFTAEVCARLLSEFPPFERGNATNEAGERGAKSTVERIRKLGNTFTALDDLIQSREFLDLIGRLTGIPNLLYDRWYFGGGTHENREGQDLDPHVDFNRHPIENWHRRLNLIVYLNPDWQDDWGGSLELHSDPRAANDRVSVITPLYNRAVIFETTETSWHGFNRIALPASKQDVSRKSIALYFYTVDRPEAELADTHSTIYVDRPLPEKFAEGHVLTDADVQELRVLLSRRDQHNQRLYRDITELGKRLDNQRSGHWMRLRRIAKRLLADWRAR